MVTKTNLKFILYLFALILKNVNAQETLKKELSLIDVINIVKSYHPIVKQADWQNDIAKNDILNAKGSFDPVVQGKLEEKNLKEQNYYSKKNIHLTIPTWYGIDIEGGWQNNQGERLDLSQTRDDLNYLGINVPILKNLIYDKRRGQLEQAKIFYSISKYEQAIIINDLCFDAIKAYWDWANAYNQYQVYNNITEISKNRLDYVKKSIQYGEKPPIDSIEAKTQYLQYNIEKQNKWTEFINKGLDLSAYLWLDNNVPYQLKPEITPNVIFENIDISKDSMISYEYIVNEGINNHPELRKAKDKIKTYSIDRKIYFQELLPKLDLNFKILNGQNINSSYIGESLSLNSNYQYSIKLSVPLRLSEGRSKFAISKIKQNIAETYLEQKTREVSLKIKTYYNQYLNFKNLTELQNTNYLNYRQLAKMEELKWQNGESNLFLINTRENKAVENVLKLIDMKTKYYKSIFANYWSAGLLK